MRILKLIFTSIILFSASLGYSKTVFAQQFDYECPAYEHSTYNIFELTAELLLTRESLEPNRIEAGFNHVQPEDLTLVTDPETCFAIRYPGAESPDEIDFEGTDDGYYYGLYESTEFYFVFPYKPGRIGFTPIIVMDKSFELVAVWPL